MASSRALAPLFLLAFAVSAVDALAYDSDYDRLYPFYLEYSTGSQVKPKKAGPGGVGGHAVLYIRGLCKDYSVGYPRVKVCDPSEKLLHPHDGVGISLDSQYKNVNWVAVPGYDFFMTGELKEGEELTEAFFEKTNARARELRIFEGVRLHEEHIAIDPKADPEAYAKKVAKLCTSTDFALTFGRNMTSHRVPISGRHLQAMADYLNAQNARYLSGKENFVWHVIKNNCAQLSAKIFAIAGIRHPIPQELPFERQLLHIAVPANGLATVQHKTNFRNIDADHVWKHDEGLRSHVLKFGELPVGAGSLSREFPVHAKNQVYFTDLKRLVLPPKPLCKAPTILRNMFLSTHRARYMDLADNLRMWMGKYEKALASAKRARCRTADCSEFMKKYATVLENQIERTRDDLAKIGDFAKAD